MSATSANLNAAPQTNAFGQPESGDLHVDALPGAAAPAVAPPKPTRHFLTKLKTLLRERVKNGALTDQDYAECVAQARGHAGGMVRSEKRKAALTAAEAAGYTGCMIGFALDAEAAAALAVKGGQPASSLHVTLAYLGDATPDLAARARTVAGDFSADQAPITGRIGGIGRFSATDSSDGKDCIVALVDSPSLPAFRQDLVEALTAAGLEMSTEHGFIPHVTLAYVEPGADAPVKTVETGERRDLAFRMLTVWAGDEHDDFALLGLTEPEEGEVLEFVQGLVEALTDAGIETTILAHPATEPSAPSVTPPAPPAPPIHTTPESTTAPPAIYFGWVRLGEAEDDVAARDASIRRLFLEMPDAFAEVPEWVPYLPKPGRYTHPRYGEITFTPTRITRFIDQFNDGLYQTQVPLDIEHETKLGGAAGWIKQLRPNADGGADARIEWTDRGRGMIEADRFKYVSPEFYDEWTDPATGKKYRDVAIGGAITTRPFFKEASLRPLAATEEAPAIDANPDASLQASDPDAAQRLLAGQNAQSPQEDPMVDEEQTKRLTELELALTEQKRELAKAKASSEAKEAEARALTERIASIEAQARTKRFTDMVMGRSEDSPLRWFSPPAYHLDNLELLSRSFGEDSPQVKAYIDRERAVAEALKQGAMFRELGRAGAEARTDDAAGKLTALAHARATERNLTFSEAMRQVAAERPELYETHRADATVKI